jgi:hypothetical protein
MATTESWAKSLGISVEEVLPPIPDYAEPCPRSPRDIAVRTVVLQGVVAVAEQVDPQHIVEWFRDEGIWQDVTPNEQAFLKARSRSVDQCNRFGWHQEAQWTLLWVIGKVELLGLPTRPCDTRRLVDEIIPPLWSKLDDFVASSKVRQPGALLAEDDRTYNIWCYAQKARLNAELPSDLNWGVLYERRYAFEWLDGTRDWDEVTCDA